MRATSAVSSATSVPAAPMATPTLAAARAGASLTPSPTISTGPYFCASSTIRSTFCSGFRSEATSSTPARNAEGATHSP